MGCFSVSCGLSSISMYSSEAALIPLMPNRTTHNNGIRVSGSYIVSNDGPRAFFHPFTLPIFGNIDTYGRLENIVEDANTKAIEKYYGMSISQFVEIIAYGEKNDKLPGNAGMFVHKDIYDHIKDHLRSEGGRLEISIWDECYFIDEVLETLGFQYIREDENRKRYNRLWKRPDFEEVKLWSDGTWIRLEIEDKEYSAYRAKELIRTIEEKVGRHFPVETINIAKMTPYESLKFEHDKKNVLKRLQLEKELAATDKLSDLRILISDNRFDTLTFNYDEHSTHHFRQLYGDCLDDIKEAYVDFRHFERSMHGCNRLYMPSYNGYQCGNHYMHRVMLEKALDIVNAHIDEYDED